VRVFGSITEFEQAAGTHLGYGGWHTISQDRIDLFAEATGDHQWIHVDPVRSATGPFGSTIAHGYLTLSMIPLLVGDVYRVGGLRMGVNYGSDRLRFPSPVPVGSRLRAGVELVRVRPGGAGVQALTRITVERQGSDKPVCVTDALTLLVAEA
jgi:acyl dehydratase